MTLLLHPGFRENFLRRVRQLVQDRDIREDGDLDQLYRELRSIVWPARRERRHMERDTDDPPHRAWPAFLTVAVDGIQLQDLAARGKTEALALGQDLLVSIVSDDAEGEH